MYSDHNYSIWNLLLKVNVSNDISGYAISLKKNLKDKKFYTLNTFSCIVLSGTFLFQNVK